MAQQARTHIWPLVAILASLYLAYDAGSQQFASGRAAFFPGPLRIQYIPDPNDIVNLAEGTPYTVPEGKLLIITDWVTTDAEVVENSFERLLLQPRIRINGLDAWGGGYSSKRQGNYSLATTGTSALSGVFRSGIRADPGDTVTIVTQASPVAGWAGTPTMFASGYLADDH